MEITLYRLLRILAAGVVGLLLLLILVLMSVRSYGGSGGGPPVVMSSRPAGGAPLAGRPALPRSQAGEMAGLHVGIGSVAEGGQGVEEYPSPILIPHQV